MDGMYHRRPVFRHQVAGEHVDPNPPHDGGGLQMKIETGGFHLGVVPVPKPDAEVCLEGALGSAETNIPMNPEDGFVHKGDGMDTGLDRTNPNRRARGAARHDAQGF